MQQPGEMAATALPKRFDNEEQPCLLKTDTPIVVWLAGGERWLARIHNRGREHTFTLDAESKDAAAAEAGIIYDPVCSAGWDATLFIHSLRKRLGEYSSSDENTNHWRARLQLRQYTF